MSLAYKRLCTSLIKINNILGNIDINEKLKDNIKGRLISNHPVHILDAEGHLSPSSLIPFCEFGENKSIMAMDIEKFNVPVCTGFSPKMIADQMCYEIDLQIFKSKKILELRRQLNTGLILVLDYNQDRVNYKDISNPAEQGSNDTTFASTLFEYQNPQDVLILIDGIGKEKTLF